MPPICTTILPILKAPARRNYSLETLSDTSKKPLCFHEEKKNFLQRLAAASCIRNLIFQLHFQALIQYENTKIYQDFPSCLFFYNAMNRIRVGFELELFLSYIKFSRSLKYKHLPVLGYCCFTHLCQGFRLSLNFNCRYLSR